MQVEMPLCQSSSNWQFNPDAGLRHHKSIDVISSNTIIAANEN